MTRPKLSNVLRSSALVSLVSIVLAPALFAQGPGPSVPTPSVEPTPAVVIAPRDAKAAHAFWDKQNLTLFVTSAAMSGADFAVTRANLQNGGQELNPMVRVFGHSTPALALNFAGETAGVIGLSYFFHKTGHHRLERVVSFVNIGSSAGAVTYGVMHR